ncbi:anti-sigma factor RsbA family regulatory protein [Streptomyces sp. TP-A0356]|uniref:anti-sigma factor RsbA family regulatory protein n=1 Tax=Streptomyces sp. TP-A0356 TaxID=1359208 RepID=UPI0006E30772|nr:anti-sigma factor RsbA family regulatory protein [Streptomyces sp. TP-A0356]
MTGTTTGRRFAHPALFYRNKEQYIAGTVPFLLEGVSAGEPVAVAAPPARLEWIRQELAEHAGQVRFIDMTEAGRNPGRIIPQVLRRFADAHPTQRVRIIGEPIWPGRTSTEYPACVQHEALINAAFTSREATILCPYDAEGLEEQVLADAWATHPVVLDEHGERVSDAYDPWEVVNRYNQLPPALPDAAACAFSREQLPEVRYFAVGHGKKLGLAGIQLEDLALAVAELTTNAVVHGEGRGVLRIWAEGSQVVCEVHDGGRLTDPLAGRRPVAPTVPGGRGLLMVNRLADLVRTQSGDSGTTIRFYLGN